jgi:hypothetical protein
VVCRGPSRGRGSCDGWRKNDRQRSSVKPKRSVGGPPDAWWSKNAEICDFGSGGVFGVVAAARKNPFSLGGSNGQQRACCLSAQGRRDAEGGKEQRRVSEQSQAVKWSNNTVWTYIGKAAGQLESPPAGRRVADDAPSPSRSLPRPPFSLRQPWLHLFDCTPILARA